MTLNYRHRLFVHYFLGDAKDDAVKAAKMAGYSRPEQAAVSLLNSKVISAHLCKKLEESGAMPVEEILARLSTIASLDVMEFISFKEEENKVGKMVEKPFLDLKKIKKLHKGNLIKELKIQPSGSVEVKFHDSVEAMDKLAKYHGMFKERIEIEHIGSASGNDRIFAIIGGIAQLSGASIPRKIDCESEPGRLCDSGEQWEVDASAALEIDQSTPALGGPEGDRSPDSDAWPETREVGIPVEILPSLDDGKET